jgi:hypothetical protein
VFTTEPGTIDREEKLIDERLRWWESRIIDANGLKMD